MVHVETLRDTHRQMLTLFGTMKEMVLPDVAAIDALVMGVFDGLGLPVETVPFGLESARSSFMKTIDKIPPSDRTQEFKDGVLWADCLQLLQQEDVCLVTSDKAFYQERDYQRGLAKELKAELSGAPRGFSIFSSVADLAHDLRVQVAIEDDVLGRAYLEKNLQVANELLKRHGFTLGPFLRSSKDVYATEKLPILYVEFQVEYVAIPEVRDSQERGVLAVKGDGYYDSSKGALSELRVLEEALAFVDSSGEQKQVRNMYAFMNAVVGHREIVHTIRYKLP